ncbi:MAG: DnaD domain protein [Acetatifactor sp.]|nr:DnaD domain protein [Acetatifactor sp.]
MARLTIYKDESVDSTVVSNHFIDEYMKDANDAQLKIYLYLLRMMNAHQATSVSDIADKFNHTEKDVIRALKYWEKHCLLDLDFDENKVLVGIHIRDLDTPAGGNRSAAVSTFVPLPASASQTPVNAVSTITTLPAQETESISAFEKPVYSADQLREFKNRQDTAQLLFIAESYIGKPLTPSEMKTILYFTDILHFSDDLIDYLLQYCVERGKKDFKYIERVAVNWAEEGITTPKQAQRAATRYDKNVYAIMNELGKSGAPTTKELEYINRWVKEYGFSPDIIFEACQRTVLATDRHRFEYAEGILSSWRNQNVHHKSDIHKIDDLYQQRRKNTPAERIRQTGNRFNQFTQNSYDFDALEQELLSN